MLEKCNGKVLYKHFGNSDVDNQTIKGMDYKLFLGLKGHINTEGTPKNQGSFLFLMLLD